MPPRTVGSTPLRLAATSGVTTPHVLAVRHWLQMRRPNAPGHAAQVVDDEAWRDRADEQFVGVAVGLDLSPRDLELSVPGPVGRCQPQPALAAGVDLRQEPLDDFDLHHDAHPLASGTDPPVIRIATAICALGLVSDPPPYPYHDDDRMPRSPTYAPPVPRPQPPDSHTATRVHSA